MAWKNFKMEIFKFHIDYIQCIGTLPRFFRFPLSGYKWRTILDGPTVIFCAKLYLDRFLINWSCNEDLVLSFTLVCKMNSQIICVKWKKILSNTLLYYVYLGKNIWGKIMLIEKIFMQIITEIIHMKIQLIHVNNIR